MCGGDKTKKTPFFIHFRIVKKKMKLKKLKLF